MKLLFIPEFTIIIDLAFDNIASNNLACLDHAIVETITSHVPRLSSEGFADEGNGNADCTENKRLLTSHAVEDKYDEEEVADGADEVVKGGYKQVLVAGDAEVVVQNRRVVAYYVDTFTDISTRNRADKKKPLESILERKGITHTQSSAQTPGQASHASTAYAT